VEGSCEYGDEPSGFIKEGLCCMELVSLRDFFCRPNQPLISVDDRYFKFKKINKKLRMS
jgi:hypothetical protein